MKPELGFDDDGRPVLITGAALSYDEQHRQRVRKYLTLMAFRVPALILAAVAYGTWHNGLISLAIIALSLPLPWIAVLIVLVSLPAHFVLEKVCPAPEQATRNRGRARGLLQAAKRA